MTDLRTYQTLAYLTYQPHMARELLGIRPRRPVNNGLLTALLGHLGRMLTRMGRWMLARAGEEMPDAARETLAGGSWSERQPA